MYWSLTIVYVSTLQTFSVDNNDDTPTRVYLIDGSLGFVRSIKINPTKPESGATVVAMQVDVLGCIEESKNYLRSCYS